MFDGHTSLHCSATCETRVVVSPLQAAIEVAWESLGDRESLMPDLAADAVLVRANDGELLPAVPRILELAVTAEYGSVPAHELIARLAPVVDESGPSRTVVLDVLDAWWNTTLALDVSEEGGRSAGEVLGALAHLNEPLVRWLGPWLVDLDGPAARHLAAFILSEGAGEAWDDVPDKRSQVLGWAATEPVVFGLTLVGGVHLDEGDLSDVLDRLL